MPAHITLIYPFTDDSVLTDGRIQVARTVFGRFSQFPFRLGSVGWFRNEAESHLYLAPEPPDPFVELVAALEGAFPEHPSFAGEFDAVVPHLTVASSSDQRLLHDVEAELLRSLPLTAVASSARIMEHLDRRWRVRADLALVTTG